VSRPATLFIVNATSRLRDALAACGVAIACAVLLVATSSAIPIVWDEGDTIERARGLAAAWDEPAEWPYTVRREGHPPLSGMLVALGERIAPASWAPLSRYRLGPMLLFAAAAGAMFYRLKRDYGLWIMAIVAAVVLVMIPRLFADAHFATLDGPLTACWMLTWATFAPARRSVYWIPLFGAMLGLTLSAKFTGWLAPLPFAAWAILYRDRAAARALLVGVPLAVLVFVALNPPLWHGPVAGLRTFFDLNLHRDANPGLNITTQFFGRLYNLDHPLPFYNTLVWTAITISPMALLLGTIGIVASVRRWRSDPTSLLVVLQWATLIVVRTLPWAPPHDGVRLFLPSFAFFAAMAGIGAGRALYRETLLKPDKITAQGWAKIMIGIVLVMSTLDSIRYFPHGLSYYNRLVGGLRGAVWLGMEPTYYWDSLDDEVLRWLDEHTADDEKVAFGSAPPKNLRLLQEWGKLKRLPDEPGRFRWYVIQRRPSAWQPADRWLIDNGKPEFERTAFGVPLLSVYPYEEYERAVEAVGQGQASLTRSTDLRVEVAEGS